MKYLVIIFLIIACGKKKETPESSISAFKQCRGEWGAYDEYGLKNKYIEYWHAGLNACVTENRSLSNWEKSSRKRALREDKCDPQPQFSSMSLKASNNYYTYRNNRIYLNLDASTGVFRRIVIGNDLSGAPTFSRDEGCFYYREDYEDEPVNPKDHGKQILLDLELASSSSFFHPMEVFKIQSETFDSIGLTRFDDNSTISWHWCPIWTPDEFCTELRNGNIFYYPNNLTNEQKDALRAQAILIRSEYNFEKIELSEFESEWEFQVNSSLETSLNSSWEYGVLPFPDVPNYIHRAWRDYLMGNRYYMPDTDSIMMPPICYTTAKRIIFEDGTRGFIKGEACYIEGEYHFTQY